MAYCLQSSLYFTLSKILGPNCGLKALPYIISYSLPLSVYPWHSLTRLPPHSLCICFSFCVEWLSFIYLSGSILPLLPKSRYLRGHLDPFMLDKGAPFHCCILLLLFLHTIVLPEYMVGLFVTYFPVSSRYTVSSRKAKLCMFSLLLYPQCLSQCLAHPKHSVFEWLRWAIEWMKYVAHWDEEYIEQVWLRTRNQMYQIYILIKRLWKNMCLTEVKLTQRKRKSEEKKGIAWLNTWSLPFSWVIEIWCLFIEGVWLSLYVCP